MLVQTVLNQTVEIGWTVLPVQASANCVYGYDRARNVHGNGVNVHESSYTVLIENTIENYLSLAHRDHYAWRK